MLLLIYSAYTAFTLLLICVVGIGILDFLAQDGSVSKVEAILSLFLHWLLISTIVVVIHFWKAKKKEILLVIFSLLFSILLAEIAIRIAVPFYNRLDYGGLGTPVYHHVYQPNTEMNAGSPADIKKVRTNEDGFRTEHSLADFLSRDIRIVVTGDSFTFGLMVDQDDDFPVQLENILREKTARNIGVLNAGVVSYSPLLANFQYAGILKKYKPHIVLHLLDATDIGDDFQYLLDATGIGYDTFDVVEEDSVKKALEQLREVRENKTGKHFPYYDHQPRKYYGALFQLARPQLNQIWSAFNFPYRTMRDRFIGNPYAGVRGSYYTFKIRIDGKEETNRFFIYRHPLEKTKPYMESTWDNIQSLAGDVKNDGAQYILAVAPRYHHWNTKEAPKNWEIEKLSRYGLNEPYQHEYIKFFNAKKPDADFPILDMLPHFQSTDQFPLCFDTDPHWNEAGNKFVAEFFADYLQDKLPSAGK